jgi:hypothetical protein
MTEDDKGLFSGGYCYSLRNSAPFKIGKDFEAPAPEGGVLPRISIEQGTKDELWSFVASRANIKADENSEAGIFYDAVKRLDFENGVSEALNWYMSDHHHQAEIPAFRKELQTLRKAIEQFKLELPSESSPLGHFLLKTFTGEVLLGDRPKPSAHQLIALQDRWRERVGFSAMLDTLSVMLRNIEAAQSLMGNRNPPRHRVAMFVQTLAVTWKNATGRWPKSGRDPIKKSQAGQFADFVRATNDILPAPFRIPALDRAIRAACKAPVGS